MGGPRAHGSLLSGLYRSRQTLPGSYRFVERWDAFRVEHPQRHRVEVRVGPRGMLVASDAATLVLDLPSSPLQLCRAVAGALLGLPRQASDASRSELMRETWAIAEPLHRLREALLCRAAPVAWRVQERVFAVCGTVPELAKSEALYRAPYLVRDVLHYRAASVALALSDAHLQTASDPEAAVRALSEWRGLFSPDGHPYRSLNRTLMNLPDQVTPQLLGQLRHVRLERPIVRPLELRTVLAFASLAPGRVLPADRLHLFQHAGEEEIRRALTRVGAATERRLDTRSDDDLRFFVRYVCDLPEARCTTFGGLVERAVEWHRHAGERREMSETVGRLGGLDTPTARPPIPLPRFKGVRFLATVGEVAREGERMKHCIASYADDAVKGRAFLFHVEHEGQVASFEVDPDGDILQAAGPANSTNPAVEYGLLRLEAWARGFHRRRTPRPRYRRPRREDPDQLPLPFAVGL